MSHLDRLHQLEERVARLEAARVDPAQDSRASTGEQDTKADVQNVPEVEVKPSTQTPTKRPRRDDEK
jgi:hypothetical protein